MKADSHGAGFFVTYGVGSVWRVSINVAKAAGELLQLSFCLAILLCLICMAVLFNILHGAEYTELRGNALYMSAMMRKKNGLTFLPSVSIYRMVN